MGDGRAAVPRPSVAKYETMKRSRKVTQLETLPRNDPNAQRLAARCVGATINPCMSAQAGQTRGAGHSGRPEDRADGGNGHGARSLETTVGDVEVEMPKLRHGTCCLEGIVGRWQRADSALVAATTGTCANGISTAKVERVARELGVASMSKSQASRLCPALDGEVAQLRESDLSEHAVSVGLIWPFESRTKLANEGRIKLANATEFN